MNVLETSNEFDILYNQVNSNQAASIDEFEKSVFLTRALDDIVKAYFNKKGNKFLEGFDDGQKRQYDFSTLIKHNNLSPVANPDRYDPRSLVFLFPEDFFLPLLESIIETSGANTYIYQVIPISYELYRVLMLKPYKYPEKNSVWRLIMDNIEGACSCEIIGRFKTNNIVYKMRYVKKPTPIILANLENEYNGLSIDGFYGNETEYAEFDSDNNPIGIPCRLPLEIHHEIILRAVELATATYNPLMLAPITNIGNISSTNLGIVPRQDNK